MSLQERLEEATEKAENASEIMRLFVTSDDQTDIPTESGPLPSLRKWLAGLPVTGYPVVMFSGTELVLDATHAGKMIWTTSDEPVFVHMPDNATENLPLTFEGGLIQGGEGKVTFFPMGEDDLVAEGDLTATAARGAPVSFKKIAAGIWWLGGQRAEGDTPPPAG